MFFQKRLLIKLKHIQPYLLIMLATLLVYIPILVNSTLVLNRDNDLQQQFWPIFHFTAEQFWKHYEFPLWNNLFFSGLPLLPDPQFSLFYPLNWLFLVFSTDSSFLIYFLLHTFLGGIAIYIIMKKLLKLSQIASYFGTFLYLSSPRLAGYLEAGHSGLVASWGLLPWVLLSTLIISRKPQYIWSVVLAFSLAGVFFTHTITFILALTSSVLVLLTSQILSTKSWKQSLTFYTLGVIMVFGLTAITLLPELEWMPQTTRSLLINARDVYPKWASVKEFIVNILFPWLKGYQPLGNIDSEKWLSLGLIPSLLATWGFWHLKTKVKLLLILCFLIVVLIALNNASPIYRFLIRLDWYALMRISTRVWFIPTLAIITLASLGLDQLIKVKIKRVVIFFIFALSVGELLFLSWGKLLKPLPKSDDYAPLQVYEFLKNDTDRFRVFCTERCFSQQEAAKANLELVEGYNTLQQTNYYKHMWQLTGGYWNYYTLTLPPPGDFKENKLQPDASSLGEYNAKYILSTYPLRDKNFNTLKQIGQFIIYENSLFKSRSYFKDSPIKENEAPILKFSPNHIRVDTSKHLSKQIILSEVYSPGWKAYLNGKQATEVLETPISLRLVDIKSDTEFVDFRYKPDSFSKGKIITLATIFLLAGIPIMRKRYNI